MRRRNGRRRQGDGADQDQRTEHADDAHQGGRQVADREVRLPDHLARDLRASSTQKLILALTEVDIAAAIEQFGCRYEDILAVGACVTIGEYLKK